MTDLTLLRTNSDHTDFKELVKLLDQDLAIRDGDDHAFYAQFNKIDAIKEVVVAFKNGISVACGAIKPFADQTAEVKRMFVHPDFRNQGIAARILNELEKWALELGYHTCVLETGIKQPEAIGLYQKVGYHITPNYGQYIGVENSVCMAKALEKS
ncbi:GNAT family N-acetyltransferase [Pedobacter yonginense]|uniref:GNAT family N-acetyltransferase n=1 Tax=Pedobacter yonginense TaxID=651869 RepID=A0A317ELW5_9SPHI|nr:GNAT family N-acetyltransferase [Pedobacter yonginense]PWS27870.1 GNAT family N-acetyltransferase [Pedobacter yonginense]